MHTLLVVDEAKKICKENNLDESEAFVIMIAALCHDIGKPETTEILNNRITSHGHEQAGKAPSKVFLNALGVDTETKDKVLALVESHMMPGQLYRKYLKDGKVTDSAIRRLATRIAPATIQDLVMVAKADNLGRGADEDGVFIPLKTDFQDGDWLIEKANDLGVYEEKPENLVSGRELLDLGIKKPTKTEGPKFGKIIRLGNKLRDLGELLKMEGADEADIDKEEYLEILKDIKDLDEAADTAKTKGIEIVNKIRQIRNAKRRSEK